MKEPMVVLMASLLELSRILNGFERTETHYVESIHCGPRHSRRIPMARVGYFEGADPLVLAKLACERSETLPVANTRNALTRPK
jgi:hypothetical protein